MEKAELIYNPVFVDDRGTFAPLPIRFNERTHEYLIKDWVQSNISVNPRKHTLRGLHYQLEPYAQAKLVKVITGSIIDFVVDLRINSETYSETFIFKVNPNYEVYVPKGFAHGFITTEDNTVVQYLVDEKYSPSNERSMLWSSVSEIPRHLENEIPNFDIDSVLISPKDKVCQTFEEKINENKFAG